MSAPTAFDAVIDQGISRGSEHDERAVLGIMMQCPPESDIPSAIREILQPERLDDGRVRGVGEHHFVSFAHKLIWKKIIELADAGKPHGLEAVWAALSPDELRRLSNGTYLSDCIGAFAAPQSGTFHARTIASATLLRQVVSFGASAVKLGSSTSLSTAEDALAALRVQLDLLQAPRTESNLVPWDVLGREALDEAERLRLLAEDPKLGQAEFRFPWIDMNDLLGPVPPGSVLVIAGRPGLGKSTFAREIARYVGLECRLPIPMFSQEMPRVQVALNMLAAGAKVRTNDLRHGTCSDDDWIRMARYLGETSGAPFEVDDTGTVSNSHIDRELTAIARKYGRPPVAYIVDHIGLQTSRGRSDGRQNEVQSISKGHKQLAMKHDTVAIILAQLNRGPEQRADKRPLMSDLRESGSLEQDADGVCLLYREDYYDKESPEAGILEANWAKWRHGSTGVIELASQLHISRIASMAIA